MFAPLLALALTAEPVRLRAMTYNLQYDAKRPADSAALVARAAPDLLCAQELTPAAATGIAGLPHRSLAPRPSGTWGVGIFSALPLARAGAFAQRPHAMPAMEATVSLGGREVVVACLHLFPPGARRKKGQTLAEAVVANAELRRQQAVALVARYARERRPVLLLGDFNETVDGDALKALLAAGFTDACASPGADCGATWPASLPVVRIDHLLGRGLRFSGAARLQGGGSDHDPVAASIEVP